MSDQADELVIDNPGSLGLAKMTPDEKRDLMLRLVPSVTLDARTWLHLVRINFFADKVNPDTDQIVARRPIEDILTFLMVCNRAGLDPLARQIYAIYRWNSQLGREAMAIQVSIDGARLVAQRTGQYGGCSDVTYYPEEGSEQAEKLGHPLRATVTVYKIVGDQTVETTASARWAEYCPTTRDGRPSGMWPKMPYVMLGKVAEMLALRKAFPMELAGLYSTEEMHQAGPVVDSSARVLEEGPDGDDS